MKYTKTKYFFIRDEQRTPVGCVASRWADDNILEVGISAWNPADRFDRQTAKAQASLRMLTGNAIWTKGYLQGKNVKLELMKWIAGRSQLTARGLVNPYSARVQKAAQTWVDKFYPKTINLVPVVHRRWTTIRHKTDAIKAVQAAKRAECANMDAMWPKLDEPLSVVGTCERRRGSSLHPRFPSCVNWRPL